MNECKVCANADNEYCFACDNGSQFEPLTNADRIRQMSDEELAKFLHDMTIISQEIGLSAEWWEQWLKSPVEVVE